MTPERYERWTCRVDAATTALRVAGWAIVGIAVVSLASFGLALAISVLFASPN